MGYLGLDWGNVPSWFTAASFSAAAYVIFRDRTHKRRQQLDSTGFWGEVTSGTFMQSGEERTQITPILYIKNASNLPVYVISVDYEVFAILADLQKTSGYRKPRPLHFKGNLSHATIPPGETKEIVGSSNIITGRYIQSKIQMDDESTMTAAMIVKEVRVQDNSGKTWKVHPRTGSGFERLAEMQNSMDKLVAANPPLRARFWLFILKRFK
ncbi:hypothetical protein P3102_22555 [Amycolatopsis sp. QT-25]|uniref:hypothetical protein n=1 Tax=Amycolatopsis sp. QT-25 TaxID=3034022 RepID=UPI0023ECF48B|nr:hypothetical protein [Amycolatopsis sp. QT-25]WET76888.1 hypothetical protein P3102_22555 [Amycolatopsis sp. QT-25]